MKLSVLPFKTLVRACAFTLALGNCAQAADITVVKDPGTSLPGHTLSLNPAQVSRFDFSENFRGAASVLRMEVAAIAPGKMAIYREMFEPPVGLDMLVTAVTGDYEVQISQGLVEHESFSPTHIQTEGGLSLKTQATFFNTREQRVQQNFGTTGGSLEITNLQVDLVRQLILGDIDGANGVGQVANLALWRIHDLSDLNTKIETHCTTGIPTRCWSEFSTTATLSGLAFDGTAFDVVSRALGLTHGGIAALSSVGDFGTVVVGVPEPSAWMMMGVGLFGLGVLRQRRRTTTQ